MVGAPELRSAPVRGDEFSTAVQAGIVECADLGLARADDDQAAAGESSKSLCSRVTIYGPKPGQTAKPVVLIEDNGPIHTSKITRAALATRAHWLNVEWLPKYAPG